MEKSFKVWDYGQMVTINTGEEFTVCRCGAGTTVFGEKAILLKATKNHLIFITESEAKVKTPIDNISYTIGKAQKEGYFVSRRKFEQFEKIINEKVRFWNDKKSIFENK